MADPELTRSKTLARKIKTALDKRKPVPLDALAELAARGDKPARKLLATRSKEDAVLEALIGCVLVTNGRLAYADVLAESKHRKVRERVVAAIAGATPQARAQLVEALVLLTPGKSRCEEDCALLLAQPSGGTFHVIEFVRAHGTPAQRAQIPELFDRELVGLGYQHVLDAVDKTAKLDSAALFDRYRGYFTRDDRETSAGRARLTAIRIRLQDTTPFDRRWLDFLLDVAATRDGDARNTALWLLEDLAKQFRKKFPQDKVRALARSLTCVNDSNLWSHLFDIIALAPDADYTTIVVERLATDLDAGRTIDALEALPKRMVADALHAHGIPTLANNYERERLDALVAALGVHAPEYATVPPKPELLWQLIDAADVDGVSRLLAAGISPETPPPSNRYDVPTPLFHAIGTLYAGGAPAESLGIVEQLLAAGARVDTKLSDTWYLHDVELGTGDTAASVTRKLLAYVGPPYDSSIQRSDPTFMEGDLLLSSDEHAKVLPAFKKLAKLIPAQH